MTGGAEFGVGEVVALHLAECVVTDAGAGFLTVQTAHDELTIAVPQDGLRLIRVRPAEGLPKPGEVWQDSFDRIWFARGLRADQDPRIRSEQVVLVGADCRAQHPGVISMDPLQVHREFGPITRIWAPPEVAPEDGAEAS